HTAHHACILCGSTHLASLGSGKPSRLRWCGPATVVDFDRLRGSARQDFRFGVSPSTRVVLALSRLARSRMPLLIAGFVTGVVVFVVVACLITRGIAVFVALLFAVVKAFDQTIAVSFSIAFRKAG